MWLQSCDCSHVYHVSLHYFRFPQLTWFVNVFWVQPSKHGWLAWKATNTEQKIHPNKVLYVSSVLSVTLDCMSFGTRRAEFGIFNNISIANDRIWHWSKCAFQCYREWYCLNYSPKDGMSMFLQKSGSHLPDFMVSVRR